VSAYCPYRAGVAADSFQNLLQAYSSERSAGLPSTVVIVVYRELDLSRADARAMMDRLIAEPQAEWSEEPWQSS
jgi:hypothetical protein